MTPSISTKARNDRRADMRRSWGALALTPVGLVAGVAVAYAVAAVIGVTLDPASGPGPGLAARLVVWSTAGLVWIAAPFAAIVLARRAVGDGARSSTTAEIVGWILVTVGVVVTVWTIAVP